MCHKLKHSSEHTGPGREERAHLLYLAVQFYRVHASFSVTPQNHPAENSVPMLSRTPVVSVCETPPPLSLLTTSTVWRVRRDKMGSNMKTLNVHVLKDYI
ncbi:hypothetical protein FQA47_024288 [Oryzias melastigma]|uniref:Uncharacterized protein n=1 Tax=Oryzias melastigma TaxID=30732 RepID=A0A834F4N9_ORYME|nr:hypothetical protein FQA47_024288 [Oryzias melastigma]